MRRGLPPARDRYGDERPRRPRPSAKPRLTRAATGTPPVLVRGAPSTAPARAARHGASKRRFDIALNIPGAEVRLPAMPVMRFGWRFASGALALLLGFILYQLWNSPNFQVEGAEIIGLQRLSPADVNIVLGVSGESVFNLQASAIRQNLAEAYPDLKNVSVEIGLPAKVVVQVEERQPVLSWVNGNDTLWVDAEGVAFPPHGDAGPLVRVEGSLPTVKEGDAGGLLRDVLRLDPALVATLVETGKHAPLGAALVFDNAHGLGWYEQEWIVFLGSDLSDMEQKLIVYEGIVARLSELNIHPRLISVEYVHAPYYRMER